MLDFSSFSVVDSHLHLVQTEKNEIPLSEIFENSGEYFSISCAHNPQEFILQKKLISSFNQNGNVKIFDSFGIHPQNPEIQYADFLADLLNSNQIYCIGECGFDLFTENFKSKIENQKEVWNIQIELAEKYNKPLIIHCRKGLNYIFNDKKKLKKVPSILFHSFFYGFHEADSLLKNFPDAYFSFGKQILNGNKKVFDCIEHLPVEKIILETDAPFQTLKGEFFTPAKDIFKVYEAYSRVKNVPVEKLCQVLRSNLFNLLSIY